MNLSGPIIGAENAPKAIAIARIVMGACFMFYGISKLWYIPGTIRFVSSQLPMGEAVFWLAVVLETGLGFLLVIGLASRWAASYLIFHCIFTGVVFHSQWAVRVQVDHMVANFVLAAGFLLIVAVGPGAWSVDNARRKA